MSKVKSFAAKSSVSRWAKKEMGADWKEQGTVQENEDGRFFFQPNPVVVVEPVVIEPVVVTPVSLEKPVAEIPVVEEEPVVVVEPVVEQPVVAFGNHYQAVIAPPAGQAGKTIKPPKPCLKGKSAIGSPCRIVWDIAEEMTGSRRKDIIAACVAKGVAYYTARTQVQKYNEAMKATRNTAPTES